MSASAMNRRCCWPPGEGHEPRVALLGKPELFEQAIAVADRPLVERRPQVNGLPHLDAFLQVRLLQLHADALLQLVDVANGSRPSTEITPRSGLRMPSTHSMRRGLAGAVGADQAEDLAVVDVERHFVHRDGLAVGLANAADAHDDSSHLLLERRFEISERALDAVKEGLLEADAIAEIAQQVRDRAAAGFVEEPARRQRACGIRHLRIARRSSYRMAPPASSAPESSTPWRLSSRPTRDCRFRAPTRVLRSATSAGRGWRASESARARTRARARDRGPRPFRRRRASARGWCRRTPRPPIAASG